MTNSTQNVTTRHTTTTTSSDTPVSHSITTSTPAQPRVPTLVPLNMQIAVSRTMLHTRTYKDFQRAEAFLIVKPVTINNKTHIATCFNPIFAQACAFALAKIGYCSDFGCMLLHKLLATPEYTRAFSNEELSQTLNILATPFTKRQITVHPNTELLHVFRCLLSDPEVPTAIKNKTRTLFLGEDPKNPDILDCLNDLRIHIASTPNPDEDLILETLHALHPAFLSGILTLEANNNFLLNIITSLLTSPNISHSTKKTLFTLFYSDSYHITLDEMRSAIMSKKPIHTPTLDKVLLRIYTAFQDGYLSLDERSHNLTRTLAAILKSPNVPPSTKDDISLKFFNRPRKPNPVRDAISNLYIALTSGQCISETTITKFLQNMLPCFKEELVSLDELLPVLNEILQNATFSTDTHNYIRSNFLGEDVQPPTIEETIRALLRIPKARKMPSSCKA